MTDPLPAETILRTLAARRALQVMVDAARAAPATREFARRREAGLKGARKGVA